MTQPPPPPSEPTGPESEPHSEEPQPGTNPQPARADSTSPRGDEPPTEAAPRRGVVLVGGTSTATPAPIAAAASVDTPEPAEAVDDPRPMSSGAGDSTSPAVAPETDAPEAAPSGDGAAAVPPDEPQIPPETAADEPDDGLGDDVDDTAVIPSLDEESASADASAQDVVEDAPVPEDPDTVDDTVVIPVEDSNDSAAAAPEPEAADDTAVIPPMADEAPAESQDSPVEAAADAPGDESSTGPAPKETVPPAAVDEADDPEHEEASAEEAEPVGEDVPTEDVDDDDVAADIAPADEGTEPTTDDAEDTAVMPLVDADQPADAEAEDTLPHDESENPEDDHPEETSDSASTMPLPVVPAPAPETVETAPIIDTPVHPHETDAGAPDGRDTADDPETGPRKKQGLSMTALAILLVGLLVLVGGGIVGVLTINGMNAWPEVGECGTVTGKPGEVKWTKADCTPGDTLVYQVAKVGQGATECTSRNYLAYGKPDADNPAYTSEYACLMPLLSVNQCYGQDENGLDQIVACTAKEAVNKVTKRADTADETLCTEAGELTVVYPEPAPGLTYCMVTAQ